MPKERIAKPLMYRKCFNTEFNLQFKKPSADASDKCNWFTVTLKNSQNNEISLIKQEYDNHLKETDMRFKLKKTEKENNRNLKDSLKVVILDLQKCLPTPYITKAFTI